MNYTQNHHLPQWIASDRIRMEDFNDAMSRIDSGMTANASAAQAAQDTADAAASAKKPYHAGYYIPAGNTCTVKFGFRPSFLVVSGVRPGASGGSMAEFVKYFAMTGPSNAYTIASQLQINDDGFTAHPVSGTATDCPDLCEKGRAYEYIAFR